MASSRNLVSTIGALASPKMGDGTRCPELPQVITTFQPQLFKLIRVFVSPVVTDEFLSLHQPLNVSNFVDLENQEISETREYDNEYFETYVYIYNGIIFPSLIPAKFFQFISR